MSIDRIVLAFAGFMVLLGLVLSEPHHPAWLCLTAFVGAARKRPKVVAVALANKTARIAWALLSRSECYIARPA